MRKIFRKIKKNNTTPIMGFDEKAYLKANPDIADAIEKNQFKDAKHHLKLFGLNEIKEGKRKFHINHATFDENVYLLLNSDINRLIKSGKISSAFEHFKQIGYKEIITGKRKWGVSPLKQSSSITENHKKVQDFCNIIGFQYDLSKLDIKRIIELNPLLKGLKEEEIYMKILQAENIEFIRLSDDIKFDTEFYAQLGKSYLTNMQSEKALSILSLSLYCSHTFMCCELLGNIYLEKGSYGESLEFYKLAKNLETDQNESFWLYVNLSEVYLKLLKTEDALSTLVSGLHFNKFSQNNQLLKKLDETIEELWNSKQGKLHGLAKTGNRNELISETNELVSNMATSYKNIFTQKENHVSQSINTRNVLIVGDFHVPQCIRYRIDQKEEQLALAGYKVTKISWTELVQKYDELFFHDIIIYYRVPSMPIIIKSITQARALGKITFYEIDDLIFDPVYPSPYETYGNSISIEEYSNLTYGMPLFRGAASLCEYAIASTEPLLSLLDPLVTSKEGFLHRNGLDSLNIDMMKKEKDYINIFYGSGTLAHNSDFIELTLSAIERVLTENKNVKLTVVGHLTLPTEFINQFKNQLILLEKTSTIEQYWLYLSGADISLAVLHNDIINNCKSELKWFEAANFKIPSVVSNTQNYLDVIEDGKDALIAGTEEEWYKALSHLVKNKKVRNEIGLNAYNKVEKNYSLEALSKNIDTIIKTALSKRGSNV